MCHLTTLFVLVFIFFSHALFDIRIHPLNNKKLFPLHILGLYIIMPGGPPMPGGGPIPGGPPMPGGIPIPGLIIPPMCGGGLIPGGGIMCGGGPPMRGGGPIPGGGIETPPAGILPA
jgi:hypothetical protein